MKIKKSILEQKKLEIIEQIRVHKQISITKSVSQLCDAEKFGMTNRLEAVLRNNF